MRTRRKQWTLIQGLVGMTFYPCALGIVRTWCFFSRILQSHARAAGTVIIFISWFRQARERKREREREKGKVEILRKE